MSRELRDMYGRRTVPHMANHATVAPSKVISGTYICCSKEKYGGNSSTAATDEDGAVFQMFCSPMLHVTSESGNAVKCQKVEGWRTMVLHHHRYDQFSECLKEPQPFIYPMAAATHADYKALCFSLRTLVKVLK